MRTTVKLDPDVAAAAERLRAERNIGLSEAVNELARAGLRARPAAKPFRQISKPMGPMIDVSNIAEVLDFLDQQDRA